MTKILIVEDDVDICDTYLDILVGQNHKFEVVHSGAAALNIVTRFLPEIVLLDMHLPGASGMLVLSFIRRYPRLAKCKVIIITGYAELAQTAAVHWGADLCLVKPVPVATLRNAVMLDATRK
jgi:CheY-like chemotaxis protein